MSDELQRSAVRAGVRWSVGFSLVELLVVMSILAVVMSLVVGVAGRVIDAHKVALMETQFTVLDQVAEDFSRQNPLKGLRNKTGNGDLRWRDYFGSYPPMDLTRVKPTLNSSSMREETRIAERTLEERINLSITGDPDEPNLPPPVLPGSNFMTDQGASSNNDYDLIESFLFYVNVYSPVSRARLAQLPGGTLTNADKDWVDLNRNGTGDAGDFDLVEIRDVWGNQILYMNDQRDRFSNLNGGTGMDGRIDNPLIEANGGKPVFVSPGPDGYFTADDTPAPNGEPMPGNPLADNVYSLPRGIVDKIDPGTDDQGVLTRLLRFDFSANEWDPAVLY